MISVPLTLKIMTVALNSQNFCLKEERLQIMCEFLSDLVKNWAPVAQ